MRFESDTFVINYNKDNENFAKQIFTYLESQKTPIFDFFGINKLSNKLNINIYDNLLDFINLLTNNGEFPDRYRPTNVATVKNNNIEILNFDLYRQAQGHQNRTFDDYLRTLAHEFVHACHMEILIDKTKQPALLMEGIATQLSKQTMYQIDYIDCSAQDLMQNFYKTHKAYHYAYTIMGYLLNTKTHDEILSILEEPHKINVNNLINETNNYLQKKRVRL